MWETIEVNISEIQNLITTHEIQIDSPDGWVPVIDYQDNGLHDEYHVISDGFILKTNGSHKIETITGWCQVKNLLDRQFYVLTRSGYKPGKVIKTGNKIPVVDITVDHKNHRYFSGEISSHNCSGGGKSIFLTHCAAAILKQGKNVLYITLEMSEERIAERIDANLMNVEVDALKNMSKDEFMTKIDKISSKTHGKLFIKEYPTGGAHAGHFRALIEELKTKQNFIPDLICVDYLGICASSRMKMGGTINTYSFQKSVAEELRSLAIENNVPVITGVQLNRTAYCLTTDTNVITKFGNKKIIDCVIGDEILSNTGFNIVKNVFPIVRKKIFKITTASGKTIKCSADHFFPLLSGEEKSLNTGLIIGDFLLTKD